MKKTTLALLATLPLTALAQVDRTGPVAVATNLMAQFYDVPESAVSVEIEQRTKFTATALAKAPGGHVCVFDMAAIEKDAKAQYRWGVAGTRCKQTSEADIPARDSAAVERAKRVAAYAAKASQAVAQVDAHIRAEEAAYRAVATAEADARAKREAREAAQAAALSAVVEAEQAKQSH